MISLIAGVALLALGLYGLKLWTKADPKVLVAVLFRALAYAALLGAVGALVTGRYAAVVPLAAVGIALLGRLDPGGVGGALGGMFGGLFRSGAKPQQTSRVRSPILEMELDHATGALSGRVVDGPDAGRALETFSLPELLELRRMCDPQSLALLEAYLDRRAPAWRENIEGDQGAGGVGGRGAALGGDAMTEQEAYQILGLQPGADAQSVRAAHRSLMKKLHPDHGGSSYLAARINQAKEVILRKHG
ncbi:DnaJ domain-containing protein [Xanthobacter sp. KR7-225]|uniref:DnaJ domain-containing protein n=1 Tax=Xanthobacter sp. KR7-225 TaxID=3156613 RepID=UPI0032B4AE6F